MWMPSAGRIEASCVALSVEVKLVFPAAKVPLARVAFPVVTFIGWWGGRLLGGVVIMEIIFAVPGMGTALVQAVSYRDYPTVQAIVFVMALIFLSLNLFVDLLYAWLDPRIRLA